MSTLIKLEKKIERGLEDAALSLAQIRDERLYRDDEKLLKKHDVEKITFEIYCNERWNFKRDYVNKLIRGAQVKENLDTIVSKKQLPSSESQTRELAKLEPEEQREVWSDVVREVEDHNKSNPEATIRPTARIIKEKVDAKVKDRICQECDFCDFNSDESLYCHRFKEDIAEATNPASYCTEFKKGEQAELPKPVKQAKFYGMSESDEWYTPDFVIDCVHSMFGQVDLDPASSNKANETVKANHILTYEDDGLSHFWDAEKLFMNPPYSKMFDWVKKVVEEHDAGRTKEALVGSRFASCAVNRRLKFSSSGNSAPFASELFYLGQDLPGFKKAFSSLGVCRSIL
jgi:hypothetical protein